MQLAHLEGRFGVYTTPVHGHGSIVNRKCPIKACLATDPTEGWGVLLFNCSYSGQDFLALGRFEGLSKGFVVDHLVDCLAGFFKLIYRFLGELL